MSRGFDALEILWRRSPERWQRLRKLHSSPLFSSTGKLWLKDINSPDSEIANLLARREHGERWDGLTAEEMLAAYDR